MTAIDTTVSLTATQIAGLRAAGVTAVSRYIAPQAWKRITPAEAARYGPAGMELVLNWEDAATNLASGTYGTAAAARSAVQQAQACGYPAGGIIYNSADWDVQAGQWATVAANLRTIRPIYRAAGYGLGLYAPWDALGWAQRDGLVDAYWQAGMSTSWSGGRNRNAWPGAHMRQRRETTIAGVACDLNDILNSAFGQMGGTDMDLNDIVPGSGLADGSGDLRVRQILANASRANDPYATAAQAWQNEQLRNSRAILAAVQKLTAPTVDLDALADKVTARLIASNSNGLTAADHAAVRADVHAELAAAAAAEASALGQ
jgi:hypothetical protein